MANATLGHCDCPICGKQADIRETKKTKAYIHCDDCGFQGFARGYSADKLLRGKMRAIVAAAPAVEVNKPLPPEVKKPLPAPTPAATVSPPKVEPQKVERTIFDFLGEALKHE